MGDGEKGWGGGGGSSNSPVMFNLLEKPMSYLEEIVHYPCQDIQFFNSDVLT